MKELFFLIPGFLTYIILRPFGLFKFYDSADRQITLLILSIVNLYITNSMTSELKKYIKINDVLLMIIISILITAVYYLLFSLYKKCTVKISNKLSIPLFDNNSTLESIITKSPKSFVICFDFNDNYISSGYIRNIDDKGNYQIAYYGDGETVYTADEARVMYKEGVNNHLNTLITDNKNKMKYYIINPSSALDS